MKKLTVLFAILLTAVAPIFVSVPVNAQNVNLICKIFPFLEQADAFNISAICGTINTNTVGTSINSTISLITSLIFIAIILFAVFVIVKAAIKYIRSEGDDTKIQEAQKAIKSVFVGIAALFIGVIGIIIVLAFFNVGDAIAPTNNGTGTGSGLIDNLLQ